MRNVIDLSDEKDFNFIKSKCDYGNAIDIGVIVMCKCGEVKYRQHILRVDKSDLKKFIKELTDETP